MLRNLTFTLLAILCFSKTDLAQWTSDTTLNTNVSALNGLSIYTPLISSTINGGSYLCWFENVSGNYEMHMQLLDSLGNKVWASNGIAVSTFPQSSAVYRYDMVTDNNGDAVLAFQDIRVGGGLNILAYKVSLTGNLVWGAAGVQLIDSTGVEGLGPKIGITTSNDAIVAWNTTGASSTKWVSFHKITSSGTLSWSGVHRIKVGTNKYSRPVVIPVLGDDFIIQYVQEVGSFPSVTSTMYLDKFNSNGVSLLAAPVKVSNKTIPYFTFPNPIFDGKDGIYISFQTANPVSLSINDTYVQHVSSGGQQWSLNGTEAANSTTTHKYPAGPAIYNSGNKETYVLMQVQNGAQSQAGIFIQKLDSLGNVLLGANGKQILPIVSSMNVPLDWQITTNGLIVFYKNGLFGSEKLRALKVDFDGNIMWNNTIVSLSGVTSNKSNVACGVFNTNQVVLAWLDDRSNSGVYAQNINNSGTTGVISTIKSVATNTGISFLQNPSSELKIKIKLEKSSQISFELLAITGQVLTKESYFLPAGNSEINIPTPFVSSGVFILKSSNQDIISSFLWVKE